MWHVITQILTIYNKSDTILRYTRNFTIIMYSISVSSLNLSAVDKHLFHNISFSLSGGDRITLVGENGVGKTSFMKLLSGHMDPDSGKITKEEWITCRFIAQDFQGNEQAKVWDYLDTIDDFDKAIRLMEQMGFDTGVEQHRLSLSFQSLSGGERRIVELSIGIHSNAYFLFIDEPENHLSLRARNVLIKALKAHWGGVMIVSHDRTIINNFSNKIIEIEDQQLRAFSGTFEEYQAHRSRLKYAEIRSWEEQKKEIQRMKSTLELLKRKAEVNANAAKTYQQRKRRYQALCDSLGYRPQDEREAMNVPVHEVKKKNGKIIAKAEKGWFAYQENWILQDVSFTITFGEKVALVGNNGCGKTTLMRLILGELEPQKGCISLGVNLTVTHLTQHNDFRQYHGKSAVDIVQRELEVDETKASSMLANILFSRTEMLKSVEELSGGQQTRLRITLLFGKKPDLIVLDEPTNNLDPTSWDVLTEALNEFSGSVLLISHDQEFIESVSDRIFYIHHGQVEEWYRDLESLVKVMS